MRLFEFAPPRLFLCTNITHRAGEEVRQAECSLMDAALEDALEAQRPIDRLSRSRSLKLATSPGGTDYTYLVTPVGKLERLHTGWLRRLKESDPSHVGVLAHYSTGYWSGCECPEARNDPWEYRVESAHIVKRIGRSMVGTS